MNLKPNAFSENLGADWLALDEQGNPLARASDEASVRQAAPDAALYANAEQLAGLNPAADAGVDLPSEGEEVALTPEQREANKAADPFDKDGDGAAGGAPPGGNKKKVAAKK